MFINLAMFQNEDDREMFLRLYHTYGYKCKARANAMLRDEQRAEDVVQDAFLKIAKYIQKFYALDGEKTVVLIVTIVKRLCLNVLKKEGRHPLLPEEYDPPDEREDSNPLSFVVSQETSRRLVDAIVALGEPHTDVLMLRYVYELSPAEVADMLGISEALVHSRLHRARNKLKAQLREEGIFHG